MRKESKIYREIFEGMSQPIFLLDEGFVIVLANPASYEYLIPTTSLEGKAIEEFLKSKELMKILNTALKEQLKVINAEIECVIRKEKRDVLVDAYPFDHNGSTYIILSLKDFTQLNLLKHKEEKEKRFETAIKSIKRIAKVMEPEISNIISVLNFVEKNRDSLDEVLEFIKKEALRLKFIIDEALDLSLDVPYEIQKTNIHRIIDDAVKSLKEEITNKNLQIEKIYSPDIPEIEGDPFELHKAIKNIIKNAIEASPENGKIEIKTFWGQERIHPEKLTLCIEITDEGKGIPEEIKENMFSPFTSTKKGHLGLGLSYSYAAIKRHGGDIVYFNDNGKTTFRILIPV